MEALSVLIAFVLMAVIVAMLDLWKDRKWQERNRRERERAYDLLIESGDNPWLHVDRQE